VKLRNDPKVNRYIHHDHLTPEAHERWLKGESMRRDSLNFVILIEDCFAGTASLYNIAAGSKCEFGRIAMSKDDRRVYAIAAEFLCLSFAFEVLQVMEVYCTVVAENKSALGFYLRSGWQHDLRYDGFTKLDGLEMSELGLSMNLEHWAKALEDNREVLRQLHRGGDPYLD
jgi:RimJ/RimL family protein N-acetyltransferase